MKDDMVMFNGLAEVASTQRPRVGITPEERAWQAR